MSTITEPLPKRIPGAALNQALCNDNTAEPATIAAEYCELFSWTTKNWTCNQCGLVLDKHDHCPDHAPTHFPGLQRLECDAEPGAHPEMFMYADNQPGYGPICFYCIRAASDTSGRWAQ